MDKGRSFEYDAFGPWIYLIEEPHKLPPLFADYKKVLLGARMSFKIPRGIERQKATPKMNLYDSVVGIFNKEIIILERKNRGQSEFPEMTRIDISRVTAIHKKNCLLNGQLILMTKDEPMILRYNTVSDHIIDAAIILIRGLIPQKDVVFDIDTLKYCKETMAIKFVNAVNRIRRDDESLKLVAYQPSLKFAIPLEFHWKPITRFGFTERVLSSHVILANSKEFVVIFCHFYPKRPSSEAYAYNYYYLPFSSLEQMTLRILPEGGMGLSVKTNGLDLFLPVDSENLNIYNFVEKCKTIFTCNNTC